MKLSRIGIYILGPSVFAILLFWGFYPYQSVISFEVLDEQEEKTYLKIPEGDHFQLTFTHSVHLSDVIEEYKLKNDRLYPVQLIYEDTAVGMPSNGQEGETFTVKDGKYYITELQGFHESITLSVGQVRANHTILYNDESYLLKDFVGAGSVIKIKPGHESNWNLMRGVTFNE
ncbi:DUF1850 domain-containing protein [Halobacillus sp. Marseille-Q1614]|uniref:DUF1850 domain-containing protein n=1 Tax=Halobacillus sp. Marseille-Q1614 TaxID=2709134 RepID=UPI00156DC055|nr:DUF1850 domain-containing protein [Halobacillus sp. Marseille-Q1614]